MRRIFQLCTCLWGGAFNPIIPVCEELPEAWRFHPAVDPSPAQLAAGYISFFEPDVFVESRPGLAEKAGVHELKLDFMRARAARLDDYFEERPHIPFGLDCRGAYQAIWNREFKFQPSLERHVGVFERGGPDSPFTEMAFGGFPEGGPLAQFARAFRESFAAAEFPQTAEAWAKAVGERFATPLTFTGEACETVFHSQMGRVVAFIADPTSPLDLIDCWNLRQVWRNVLPVNLNWLRAAQDALSAVAPTVSVRAQGLPLLEVIFGRSVLGAHGRADYQAGQARLKEAGFGLEYSFGCCPDLWIGRRNPWDRMAPPRPQRVSVSAGRTSSDLELPDDRLCQPPALAPPFADEFGDARAARWANVLTFSAPWGEPETLALLVPPDFDATKPRRFGSAGAPCLVSREGLVPLMNFKHDRWLFRLMTGPEALTAWLSDRGTPATRSSAGRAADQVLERLGGTRGTFIIQDKRTLEFLDEVARKRTKSAHHARWAGLLNERAERSKTRPAVVPGIANFVDCGAARLGLEIKCPKCSEANWYAATELRQALVCDGCLGSFTFPEGTLDLRRSPWHYRVTGPFSKPGYADGAYAVALAISLFARRLDVFGADVTYAAGLELVLRNVYEAKRKVECDFALWYRPRLSATTHDAEPALIFGEAKSFGRSSLQRLDVVRLWRLWARFPHAFVAFATMREKLEDAEVRRIRSFVSAARGGAKLRTAPIIILTGTELFCTHSVEASWTQSGGKRAEFAADQRRDFADPWCLADLTQQVYLGLPEARGVQPVAASGA